VGKVGERGSHTYLKGTNGGALESEVCLEVLSNLTDKALEWKLPDKELSGFLVAPDLTEGHGTGLVTVRLFDSSGGRGALSGGFGGQLLPGGLSSSGLTGGLFCTGHD
jgi:hypothetical protein